MGQVDVEVRVAASHPAEVEEQARLHHSAGGVQVAVDADLKGRRDLEVFTRTAALLEAGPQVDVKASGEEKIGIQPSQISAAISTDLRPIAPTKTGISLRIGWMFSFNALPWPIPSGVGSG